MSDPNKTQMLTEDPNRTRVSSEPSLSVTQTIQPIQCPVCRTHNPPGVVYCVECGLVFSTSDQLPGDVFSAPPVRPPCLIDEAGREQYLRPGENTVGREGDVLLTDPRCSRRHAKIYYEQDRIFLEDVGSTNGTQVNGEPLPPNQRIELKDGDKISFAGFEMTVAVRGGAGATAMPNAGKTTQLDRPPTVEAPIAMLTSAESSHPLKPGANRIGRKPDNDVVLSDPFVSGAHGVLEIEGGAAFYTDVGSTNGSYLNGAKLEPNQRTPLKPDDELQIGQTTYRVEWSQEQKDGNDG
jgi:pSer/pThr/pTyr-binding forkhead associated (FHA) protein